MFYAVFLQEHTHVINRQVTCMAGTLLAQSTIKQKCQIQFVLFSEAAVPERQTVYVSIFLGRFYCRGEIDRLTALQCQAA